MIRGQISWCKSHFRANTDLAAGKNFWKCHGSALSISLHIGICIIWNTKEIIHAFPRQALWKSRCQKKNGFLIWTLEQESLSVDLTVELFIVHQFKLQFLRNTDSVTCAMIWLVMHVNKALLKFSVQSKCSSMVKNCKNGETLVYTNAIFTFLF